jgi:hypothetical protein
MPLTENGTEYPVRIWLDKFSRKNYDDVNNLTLLIQWAFRLKFHSLQY